MSTLRDEVWALLVGTKSGNTAAVVALIEQREKAVRREALEEACRAMCSSCARGLAISLHKPGWYIHRTADKGSFGCAANAIRALTED